MKNSFTRKSVAPISKSFFAVSGSMFSFLPDVVAGMSSMNDTFLFDAIEVPNLKKKIVRISL